MKMSKTQYNFTEKDTEYMRIDWEYKQVVKNLKIETKEDVDKAHQIIKDWFPKNELRQVNKIIEKLQTKYDSLM